MSYLANRYAIHYIEGGGLSLPSSSELEPFSLLFCVLPFCTVTYFLFLYPFKIHPSIILRIRESEVTLQEDKVKTAHAMQKGTRANI